MNLMTFPTPPVFSEVAKYVTVARTVTQTIDSPNRIVLANVRKLSHNLIVDTLRVFGDLQFFKHFFERGRG